MDPLGTAIVGYGNAGAEIHEPVVRAHPDLELVAVCDEDERRLTRVAGPTRTYADVETMLAREDVDVAHVCTPPASHVPVAETLLAADVSVLVEKPAATATDAVDRLAEAAAESEGMASVVHDRLFAPTVEAAREAVESGAVGEVVSVTTLYAIPLDLTETERGEWVFELPGAEIGEGLVHQVYYPLAFVDGLGAVESVTTTNFRGYDHVDFDGFTLVATDGTGRRQVTVQFLASSTSRDLLVVNGTEGTIEVDLMRDSWHLDPTATAINSVDAGTFLSANLGIARTHLANVARTGATKAWDALSSRLGGEPAPPHPSHYRQVDAFAEAVRAGGSPPVSLSAARDAVAVLEAIDDNTGTRRATPPDPAGE